MRTQTSKGVLRAAELSHGMGGNTRWQMRMGCMKQIQAAETKNQKDKTKTRQGRSKGVTHKEPSRAYSEIGSSCHQA